MSLGGSSSSQSQLDPELKKAFLNNVTNAQNVAQNLGPRQFADFNPDQQAAFELARRNADPNSLQQQQMQFAGNALGAAAMYTPERVGGTMAANRGYTATTGQAASTGPIERVGSSMYQRGDVRDVQAQNVSGRDVANVAVEDIASKARRNIRDVQAGSFLNQNMQAYMNPYTEQVVNQSLSDIDRSRQLQQQQGKAQAVAAKAFGGSRQGVAEAETNRAFAEQAARTASQLRQQGFTEASRLSEADLARQMQAQQLNQAQDTSITGQSLNLAGQFGLANQDAAMRAQLANQNADLSSAQFNAGLRQQGNLANQAAFNQNQQFNTANQQAMNLANMGAQNQAAQFGAGAFNTAGLANQQNFLQANMANQQAGLAGNVGRINAASQLGNLAGQGQQMNTNVANQLGNVGAMQQGFSQQQLDAIRNLPLEQQQIINQALGINVGGGSGMQSSSSSRQGLLGLFRG